MISSENFKKAWWFILVIVIGFYLFERYEQMIGGKPSNLDLIVFLVWVCICLAPLFQEMSIFGIKLKQQIDDMKKDLNYQLSMMKIELQSSIDVSNANQNHISVNTSNEPHRDSELPEFEEKMTSFLKAKGLLGKDYELPEASQIAVEMFKVRLAFERLVADHTSENTYMVATDISRRRKFTVGRTLNELRRYSPISGHVLEGVSEIISICNYAIHNEKLSEKQIDFVRNSASSLYHALETEFREHAYNKPIHTTAFGGV